MGRGKYKIILVDMNTFSGKPEKVMKGSYDMSQFLEVGQTFCEEFGYDTFRVEKVIKKRNITTKKSKKSIDTNPE